MAGQTEEPPRLDRLITFSKVMSCITDFGKF